MEMGANIGFENPSFADPSWLMGNAVIVPETDNHIFIGFHACTESGMGMFVDQVMVEDWGPVGVNESNEREIKSTLCRMVCLTWNRQCCLKKHETVS